MLNSCDDMSRMSVSSVFWQTNLLNGHDHLYGIKTVQTEIVCKVRLGGELSNVSHGRVWSCAVLLHTLEASLTCESVSGCSFGYHGTGILCQSSSRGQ